MRDEASKTEDTSGKAGAPAAILAPLSRRQDATKIAQRVLVQMSAALAHSSESDDVIPKILGLAGEALGACRIQIFTNNRQTDGELSLTPNYIWPSTPANCANGTFTTADNRQLFSQLERGDTAVLTSPPAKASGEQPIALVTPVFVDGKWWGEIEIHRPDTARGWSEDDIDLSKIAAGMIGAAIGRAQAVKDIANATRIIENSATVLFRFAAEKPHPLTYISENITRYGFTAEQFLSSPHLYLELVHPDDLQKVTEVIGRVAERKASEASLDVRMRTGDGRYLWFDCRISAVRHKVTDAVTEIEGLAIDIDRRKATDSYIAQVTLTDQITGLGNRAAFMEELRIAFGAVKRGANSFAVLYIDLDHFKDINDVLGHSKGDALIKLVARRLQNTIRDGDFVARVGGDEFAILEANLSDPSEAGALAARILRELGDPPYDIGTQVDVTASIGIAFYGPEMSDPEEVLKHADMALYRAKESGRNQFHFHSEALDVAIIERVTLAGDLRRGLDRGEFELYYQPQVDARSGTIVGIEALARWHHPKQGLLLPGHFIPVAEKTGAIIPLGRWVIDNACQQIAAWRADGLIPPKVSLNVSAVQMKSPADFERELVRTLQSWNVEPADIELELTESVLMTTTREHRELIDRLTALGISIAIDDFGTGYSSLGYLRAYRVSHIKIAQEFIQHVEEGSGDVAIIRAAISLGRELGIKVIAEGVETAFQLRLLMQAGCTFVQGFYFSEPVPAPRMGELLRQKNPFPSASNVPTPAN